MSTVEQIRKPTDAVSYEEAMAQAKAEALERLVESGQMLPGCEVVFLNTVPYSGTEPLITAIARPPLNEHYTNLPA
jgi:hypothetical protein